jgi:hypothetical protein
VVRFLTNPARRSVSGIVHSIDEAYDQPSAPSPKSNTSVIGEVGERFAALPGVDVVSLQAGPRHFQKPRLLLIWEK